MITEVSFNVVSLRTKAICFPDEFDATTLPTGAAVALVVGMPASINVAIITKVKKKDMFRRANLLTMISPPKKFTKNELFH